MIAGEVFKLKDQLSIPETGVNSLTFYKDDNCMVVLHAINKGQSIPPHSAPGPTIVLALEGVGMINYQQKELVLNKGDSVILEPGVIHDVFAIEPYKFALFISRK